MSETNQVQRLVMPHRWCCKCNTLMEIINVEGIDCSACMRCSETGYGYTASEKEIALELQDHFKHELYQVSSILSILRKHNVV